MASTTPNLALPYPAASDPPDGPGGIYNLATRLDTISRTNNWVTYSSQSNWGTTTNNFRYRWENGSIRVRGTMTLTTGFSITSVLQLTAATATVYEPGGSPLGTAVFFDLSTGKAYPGFVIGSGNANQVNVFPQGGNPVMQLDASATSPLPWANGDFVAVDYLYTAT